MFESDVDDEFYANLLKATKDGKIGWVRVRGKSAETWTGAGKISISLMPSVELFDERIGPYLHLRHTVYRVDYSLRITERQHDELLAAMGEMPTALESLLATAREAIDALVEEE
jgi:hypothetical protein